MDEGHIQTDGYNTNEKAHNSESSEIYTSVLRLYAFISPSDSSTILNQFGIRSEKISKTKHHFETKTDANRSFQVFKIVSITVFSKTTIHHDFMKLIFNLERDFYQNKFVINCKFSRYYHFLEQ